MNDIITPQPTAGQVEFDCPACKTTGRTRKLRFTPQQPEICNGQSVSLVVLKHPTGLTCDYCNAYFVVGLMGVQVAANWVIEPAERPSAIVAAPPGLRVV